MVAWTVGMKVLGCSECGLSPRPDGAVSCLGLSPLQPSVVPLNFVFKVFSKLYFIILQSLNDNQIIAECYEVVVMDLLNHMPEISQTVA